MGWIGPVVAGLSGLGGLFGGSKVKSSSTTDTSSTPNYDPQTLAFKNYLESAFQQQTSPEALQQFGDAYTTAGTHNIQRNAGLASNSLTDILSSRGIGRTTAGAATLADNSYRAGGDISSFLNNAPLLLDQRKQALLTGAGGFLSSLPVGTNTHSTMSGVNVSGPTSPAAGFIGGASQGLASWLGQLNAQQSFANILKSLSKQDNIPYYTPGPYQEAG